MKSKLLKTLSVVALLGCGVIGTVACTNNATSEQPAMSIVAENNTVAIGESIQLMLNRTGAEIKWISGDKSIATVSEDGLVTGVNEGEVTISAMTSEGKVDIVITVTDPESDVRGSIVFDEAKVPSEIIIGDDNAVNVEDFVTVSKVSHWSLVTESTTVEINGHTITGVDYGEFVVTIKAGKTRRALEGRVVSSAKVKFNKFIDSIEGNYTIMSNVTGLEMVNLDKGYYASVSDATQTSITMSGSMPGKDGKQYAFDIVAGEDSEGNVDLDNGTFAVNKGYGRKIDTTGLDKFNADGKVGSSTWTEILNSGEPSGAYFLEDEEVDQYSTVVSNFLDRIAPDYYININSMIEDDTGYGIAGLAVIFGNDGTYASFFPVNEKGNVVQYVTYGNQQMSTIIQISEVGTTSIKQVENWIANPTYPEQVDISELTAFFENMKEKKTFTSTASASWINPKTGEKIDCPNGMKVKDKNNNTVEVMPTFDYTAYANANAVYKKVENVNEYYDAGIGSSGDSTTLLISKNEKIYVASATTKDGEETWGSPNQNTTTSLTDIWGENSVEVPTIVLQTAEEGGDANFLDLASFEDKVTDETSTTWAMNFNGEDTEYNFTGINYGGGINAIMATQTDYYAAIYMTFWMGAQNWIYDACEMSFVLSENGTKLTYNMEFTAGSTISYLFTISFYDVGTDNMPAAAQAIVDAIE